MLHDNEGDSCRNWEIVNELTSRETNNSCINEIKNNGISIQYKSQELSEAFNNHFSTIGPKLANAIYFNESGPSPLDYI